MQKTSYIIYWTAENEPQSVIRYELSEALKITEELRGFRRDGAPITHITMASENVDMVGEQGVDSIVNGLTPSGFKYEWKKDRAGRFKEADKTKIHIKQDDQT